MAENSGNAAEAEAKRKLVAETFGSFPGVYNASPFFHLAAQRLVELAGLPQGAHVLDVATGAGAVLFPVAERVGPSGRVSGIDFADPMVAWTAAEIARRGVPNATVRQMNAEHLDFANEMFDAATCGFALWFIPDLAGALREIARVLRPGARFTVSTWGPSAGDAINHRYNQMLEGYGQPGLALGSHNLTTSDSVTAALSSAGFTVTHASDENLVAQYQDEEEFWEKRTSNMHLQAGKLDPEQHKRFKAEVFSLLQAYKKSGVIEQTRAAVFASGVKQG